MTRGRKASQAEGNTGNPSFTLGGIKEDLNTVFGVDQEDNNGKIALEYIMEGLPGQ